MKKVIVIGSGGAGKTTFSKRLGQKLKIEVIHLDTLYWRPGWARTPKEEWADRVRGLLARETWIMDGNFGGTRGMRLAACDTVIFLDMPRWRCLYRVVKRYLKYHGRERPEMSAGCNEKLDIEFLAWIWNYAKKGRQTVHEDLKRFNDKDIVILRSTREADNFLRNAT